MVVVLVVLCNTLLPLPGTKFAKVCSLKRGPLVVVVPDHCVCHAFHTVPIAFLFCAKTVSKLPSRLITSAGVLSVSNHSSPDGESLQIPVQVKFRTGLRFSILVAYGCCTATTSV